MLIDINTPETRIWVDQFMQADQSSARELLEAIDFVTADQFQQGLTQLLEEVACKASSPAALFVERELPNQDGVPAPLYRHSQVGVRRAEGVGPPPVKYENSDSYETGSEGLIANFITNLSRLQPNKFLVHPSAEQIREQKPQRFVIVTDFIGSGDRVRNYLEAARRTPSIVSWASYGLVRFEVVAYTGTEQGILHVEKHSSHPTVNIVKVCPTLSLLQNPARDRLVKLCKNYCPNKQRRRKYALGYRNTGALLVFAHGAPNNTPLLLYKKGNNKGKRWHPLFPARSTINVYAGKPELSNHTIDKTLLYLGETQLSRAGFMIQADPTTQETILVLAALKRKPHSIHAASARTGLHLKLVDTAISRGKSAGFLTDDLRLTDAAYKEFSYLRKQNETKQKIDGGDDSYYYPSMLRPPIETFR